MVGVQVLWQGWSCTLDMLEKPGAASDIRVSTHGFAIQSTQVKTIEEFEKIENLLKASCIHPSEVHQTSQEHKSMMSLSTPAAVAAGPAPWP